MHMPATYMLRPINLELVVVRRGPHLSSRSDIPFFPPSPSHSRCFFLTSTAHHDPQHHGKRTGRRGRHDGRSRIPPRAVVLRDARVHALVDDGRVGSKRFGAMPRRVALPALLQRAHRLPEEPVLATDYNVLLLWPPQPRSAISHLLPTAVLAPA